MKRFSVAYTYMKDIRIFGVCAGEIRGGRKRMSEKRRAENDKREGLFARYAALSCDEVV